MTTTDSALSKRGRLWFEALTSGFSPKDSGTASLLMTDAKLGEESARFLSVVPNPEARFPMARNGELGVEEAYALALAIRDVMDTHKAGERRPIVAIVDVKSQAYGRREETVAIYHAAATAADAYATARNLGHPVITLVVGQALSGGFLTHGYQANRILAFDDPGVVIHAMHKEAAARVTRRTVSELNELAKTVIPISYDIKDYAKLGILHELLSVKNVEEPRPEEINMVSERLTAAIADTRAGARDLASRWTSKSAQTQRKATISTREAIFAQWDSAK